MIGEDFFSTSDGKIDYDVATNFVLGTNNVDPDAGVVWDGLADLIQNFGFTDKLDLSNLGIMDKTELEVDGSSLVRISSGDEIANFSSFNNGLDLSMLLEEDAAYLTYSPAV